MQSELVGVKNVHIAARTETVGNDGNTAETDGFETAVKVDGVDVSTVRRQIVLIRASYAAVANDKVCGTAGDVFELVHYLLYGRIVDNAFFCRNGFRRQPKVFAARNAVQRSTVAENCAE